MSQGRATYQVTIDEKAAKQLGALPREAQQRIGRKIRALALDPRPHGVLKMQGDDNLYRIRAGDYRVLYEIHDAELRVLVIRVGDRRDVYRP